MKVVLWAILAVSLATSSAYAEDAIQGRYVVKNAKIDTGRIDKEGQINSIVPREALLKIDTSTGRVWEWIDNTGPAGHDRYWQELADEDTMNKQGKSI